MFLEQSVIIKQQISASRILRISNKLSAQITAEDQDFTAKKSHCGHSLGNSATAYALME
jgi:hypothetical protein